VGILQDYKEAARLRDMIKALECEDPVLRLKTMMEKAIAEEQYAVLHWTLSTSKMI
jgi:ApaG protein